MGKSELVTLLSLSSQCLVIIVGLSEGIGVFPDHTHFFSNYVPVAKKPTPGVSRFSYDLSDTQDELKCWRNGVYILWKISSLHDPGLR